MLPYHSIELYDTYNDEYINFSLFNENIDSMEFLINDTSIKIYEDDNDVLIKSEYFFDQNKVISILLNGYDEKGNLVAQKELNKIFFLDSKDEINLDAINNIDLSINHLVIKGDNLQDVSLLKCFNLESLVIYSETITNIPVSQFMEKLEYLNLYTPNFRNTKELRQLINLKNLSFYSTEKSNYKFINSLKQIEILNLTSNYFDYLEFDNKLDKLYYLQLNKFFISDTSFIDKAINLDHLVIRSAVFYNNSDINAISNEYNKIKYIHIKNTYIENLDFIKNSPNLETFLLDNVSGFKFLPEISNLNNLQLLSVCTDQKIEFNKIDFPNNIITLELCNGVVNEKFFDDIKNVEYLFLKNVDIDSIKPLLDLKELKKLHLESNNISDFSYLEDLESLYSLSIINNNLKEISFLNNLQTIVFLDLSSNLITDLSPINNLDNLRKLIVEDNPIDNFGILTQNEDLEIIR